MYITNTTEKVRELFEKLDSMNDEGKLKILISIFNILNNNKINNRNEENPDLVEDDDLVIFNMESIGFNHGCCTIFLQYNMMLYNSLTNVKLYEQDGNVMGFEYNTNEKEIISYFEKLSFNEKLDVIAELIIRDDNGTYLKNHKTNVLFSENANGFEIAKNIINYKNNIK